MGRVVGFAAFGEEECQAGFYQADYGVDAEDYWVCLLPIPAEVCTEDVGGPAAETEAAGHAEG